MPIGITKRPWFKFTKKRSQPRLKIHDIDPFHMLLYAGTDQNKITAELVANFISMYYLNQDNQDEFLTILKELSTKIIKGEVAPTTYFDYILVALTQFNEIIFNLKAGWFGTKTFAEIITVIKDFFVLFDGEFGSIIFPVYKNPKYYEKIAVYRAEVASFKPPCEHGSRCYRKNIYHINYFDHSDVTSDNETRLSSFGKKYEYNYLKYNLKLSDKIKRYTQFISDENFLKINNAFPRIRKAVFNPKRYNNLSLKHTDICISSSHIVFICEIILDLLDKDNSDLLIQLEREIKYIPVLAPVAENKKTKRKKTKHRRRKKEKDTFKKSITKRKPVKGRKKTKRKQKTRKQKTRKQKTRKQKRKKNKKKKNQKKN